MDDIGSRWLAAAGLLIFGLFYRRYAKWLASARVFNSDGDSTPTPAHSRRDGVDFVPARRHVLFGHHFTSIAGAAPIVGPAIAVIWGWLPAFLWVVLGSVLIGCVHDFGNLVVSARNEGRSLADLTGEIIGPWSRTGLLLLVMLLTWIVLAVFAVVIGILFAHFPQTIVPINLEIVAAAVIGWLVYKSSTRLLWPSLVILACLYGAVVWSAEGERFDVVPESLRARQTTAEQARMLDSLPFQEAVGQRVAEGVPRAEALSAEAKASAGRRTGEAMTNWVWLLLGYSAVASLLPVWMLLQPRDLINSHQLFLGLGLMYVSVLWFNPAVVAPVVDAHPAGAMPLFPILFITIACGAISGFHGLVASGTTSKQLDSMKDARVVGYGGMIGEAALGLMAVIACTAGFADKPSWNAHYASWSQANGLLDKVRAFVEGGGNFLRQLLHEGSGGWLVPETAQAVSTAVIAVLVISFAATTLDSACRIQRFILQEIATGLNIPLMGNRFVATGLAAFTPLILVLGDDPLWKGLWPVFGATNQLLGALALLVLTVYLARRRRVVWPTLLPMAYLMVITFSSLILKFLSFQKDGKTLLMVICGLLIVLAVWIAFEGLRVLRSWATGRLVDGEFTLR